MTPSNIRTRFAPSPTGNLHMGGARTALFSYCLAKHHDGAFLLRIEDTDQARKVPGAFEDIMESLRWLGLVWDEGPDIGGPHAPYVQSARQKLYKEFADQLVKQGSAYRCFCTPERLAKMRLEQQQQKLPPRYDGHCRGITEDAQKDFSQKKTPLVVRFMVPKEGEKDIHDVIHGTVHFRLADIDDFVLVKSDGFPTYHLANVVDDHLMQITHVIRGEEWLPSTPKHVLLYEALGWEIPTFAHLSIFLSAHGGKMSKRDGATAVAAYRAAGYLPEAVVNFIALLGWNPKTTEELFTLTELTQRFDLQNVNVANPIFDITKLQWMQKQYLRRLSFAEGMQRLQEFLPYAHADDAVLTRAFFEWMDKTSTSERKRWWQWFRERSTTLVDIARAVDMLNMPNYAGKLLVWKKSDSAATEKILIALANFLQIFASQDFRAEILEKKLQEWIAASHHGVGDVLWPLRVALSGEEKSPPPFELAEMLGKDETLRRLQHAHALLKR